MLLRSGGGFFLRRDVGGEYLLLLHRVPVDAVGKRVRVRGRLSADGTVEADGVGLIRSDP